MSFDGFVASAEAVIAETVLRVLRDGLAVREALGDPARVVDGETRVEAFPYVRLERHEVRPGDAVSPPRHEHVLQFVSLSRHSGLSEAKGILGALRAAIEATDWSDESVPGQRIVTAMVTYSDVMRTRDRRAYRGVLRVKLITEVLHAGG
ncbi:DUF3168 domain-containing protein [Hyphomonas sp. FCG-A18]|uniref:DUF3168 domain-containing protein n=1 Tax=Hyphomonas sp. FCG-A18 TaxID=3080019 RepID=UPI002B321862|nr:DUF3168 domain-containing protein [Hyphomonas sp. FCG-A18]